MKRGGQFIKKVGALFLCIMVMISILGCSWIGKRYYDEYNLDEAYEQGFLTQEHLRSIAYYHNNYFAKDPIEPDFDLIPKAPLSRWTIKRIKLSYLQRPYIKKNHPDATVKDFSIFQYYGTYDGFAVVKILDNLVCHDLRIEPEYTIGGVVFYDYCAIRAYDIKTK